MKLSHWFYFYGCINKPCGWNNRPGRDRWFRFKLSWNLCFYNLRFRDNNLHRLSYEARIYFNISQDSNWSITLTRVIKRFRRPTLFIMLVKDFFKRVYDPLFLDPEKSMFQNTSAYGHVSTPPWSLGSLNYKIKQNKPNRTYRFANLVLTARTDVKGASRKNDNTVTGIVQQQQNEIEVP